MCIHVFKNFNATRLLVLFITVNTTAKTRLLQDERGSYHRNYRYHLRTIFYFGCKLIKKVLVIHFKKKSRKS